MKGLLGKIGPGILIAATGVGAGDLIAAAVAGANYGLTILWAVVLGGVLKFILNEGIARYQLSTGNTLLVGWRNHLPNWVSQYFVGYLFLWGFIVAGALMAACGLAAHAIFPALSVKVWGMVHALVALGLVSIGSYRLVEKMMHFFITIMFIVVVACAVRLLPPAGELLKALVVPRVPEGSVKFILSVIGGVGGSVTILAYGYWIREKGWSDASFNKQSRLDLVVAYSLTILFGLAVMIISAQTQPEVMKGSMMVLGLADQLELSLGLLSKWIFLIGFWGAVFSSMLGVWQGVPYIFADFKRRYLIKEQDLDLKKTKSYRFFMLYLAIPPMILLFVDQPVWIIVLYAVTGAFFMPFLASTLLYLNNRFIQSKNRNGKLTNVLLLVSLVVFVALLLIEVIKRFQS